MGGREGGREGGKEGKEGEVECPIRRRATPANPNRCASPEVKIGKRRRLYKNRLKIGCRVSVRDVSQPIYPSTCVTQHTLRSTAVPIYVLQVRLLRASGKENGMIDLLFLTTQNK